MKVTEMGFLDKEEERSRARLEMHEKCAMDLREEISAIQKIREELQRQSKGVDCLTDQSCER